MERLTHERNNGIKCGYWSPNKKEELVDRLAEYENTGLTPAQIREIDKLYLALCRELTELRKLQQWIPVSEKLPEDKTTVLATVWHKRWIADYDSGNKDWWTEHPERYEVCMVYRDGNEYIKMDDSDYGNITYVSIEPQEENLAYPIEVVTAWMPLPEPYKAE